MTESITAPCPHAPDRPVLRRLADILPPPEPAASEPAPAARPHPDPAASVQVERMLRAAVEILGGRRPERQLAAVLPADLLTYLVGLRSAAGHLQPRLRKVLTQHQGAGALEAVALITLSTGVRALAARFEQHLDDRGNRWHCTALQLRLTSGDMAVRRRSR
ncbi:MAG: Rv3235 family protein [Pseudonocardiaceae bacterium]